jgi:glucose/arabinose dehydrogenase
MSFDPQTGSLWTGDVGQGSIEEIDIITSGANYGWKLFEGTDCFSGDCDASGLTPPVFEYDHDAGDKSITGGYVYRGESLSSLTGHYIYGDFLSGRIWALHTEVDQEVNNRLLIESGLNISSFGTDANNEIYVCGFDGNIYRLVEN